MSVFTFLSEYKSLTVLVPLLIVEIVVVVAVVVSLVIFALFVDSFFASLVVVPSTREEFDAFSSSIMEKEKKVRTGSAPRWCL